MELFEEKSLLPVILAGGAGKRLHPLSSAEKPKQFLKVNLNLFSTFQKSLIRARKITSNPIIIVSNVEFSSLLEEQIREINLENFQVIYENYSRNTGPALTLALMLAKKLFGENQKIMFFPSDHETNDEEHFLMNILKGLNFLYENDLTNLLLGFRNLSSGFDERFGYILPKFNSEDKEIMAVQKFVEKPNMEKIANLSGKRMLINSGIIFASVDFLLKEIEKHSGQNFAICQQVLRKAAYFKNFIYVKDESYALVENLSVDYMILEKIENLNSYEASTSWQDIGSLDGFFSFYENGAQQVSLFDFSADVIEIEKFNQNSDFKIMLSDKVMKITKT